MSVARVIEISSTSSTSFDDAIQQGIDRAHKTVRHITSAWIKEQRIQLSEGKVVNYQVNMLLTFVLDEGDAD